MLHSLPLSIFNCNKLDPKFRLFFYLRIESECCKYTTLVTERLRARRKSTTFLSTTSFPVPKIRNLILQERLSRIFLNLINRHPFRRAEWVAFRRRESLVFFNGANKKVAEKPTLIVHPVESIFEVLRSAGSEAKRPSRQSSA